MPDPIFTDTYPFTYVSYFPLVLTTVNSNKVIALATDTYFILQDILCFATVPAIPTTLVIGVNYQLQDLSTGRYFSTVALPDATASNILYGNGNNQRYLIRFSPGTRLFLRLDNQSGINLGVTFALKGYKARV